MFRNQSVTTNTNRGQSNLVDVLIYESGPFAKALTDEDPSEMDDIPLGSHVLSSR